MPTRITFGIPEVDRRLAQLAGSDANRIARAAINAGLTPLVKAMKQEIDAEPISSDLKRALKKTIGKRLTLTKRKYGVSAKAGFGVGKSAKSIRKAIAKRAAKGKRKGVGVGAANVHWFALGTQQRFTEKPRRYVGSIKPVHAVRRVYPAFLRVRQTIEAKARQLLETRGW